MEEREIEQANALADSIVAAGVERARARLPKPEGFDGYCDCGAEVPQERINDRRWNCVHCQAALERRHKLFIRGG